MTDPFDWRDLLKRYIKHVDYREGVDFLDEWYGSEHLSEAEMELLRDLVDGKL